MAADKIKSTDRIKEGQGLSPLTAPALRAIVTDYLVYSVIVASPEDTLKSDRDR
ncbi:MAG: hypothetical protein WAK10_05715 [Methanoregula sp.]